MRIKIMINEGEIIPKWYGVAWRAYDRMQIACYPIPLNLIVRIYLHFYYCIMRGCFRSNYEKELIQARFEGMKFNLDNEAKHEEK
jgi:hypothetical protein